MKMTRFLYHNHIPGILNQLGAESLTHLKKLASNVTSGDGGVNDGVTHPVNDDEGAEAGDEQDDDDDDVPDLVENFDEASKEEGIVRGAKEQNFKITPTN